MIPCSLDLAVRDLCYQGKTMMITGYDEIQSLIPVKNGRVDVITTKAELPKPVLRLKNYNF